VAAGEIGSSGVAAETTASSAIGVLIATVFQAL
jgi:hypothetical protein